MTNNNKSNDKNLPHDALFKRIMENNIAAKEFLNEYLPQEVKDIVDLDKDTLKIVVTSGILTVSNPSSTTYHPVYIMDNMKLLFEPIALT